MKQKNWYYLIDGIRGIALINMIAFHFFYDLFIVFGLSPSWYFHPLVRIWQQFICITFIFISGISFHFSRNNLKRGLILNLYGLCITAVTVLFLPSESIWFGILNFIGCATLLMALLDRALKKLHPVIGMALSILLFLLFRDIQYGTLGFFSVRLVEIPAWLYEFKPFTILGLPYASFSSSDYFPLLPWFFLFTGGYWFWMGLKCREPVMNLCRIKLPVLSAIGSKSIWIYLAHQPIVYGLAWLITYIIPG